MIPCKTFLSDEIPHFSSAKSRTNMRWGNAGLGLAIVQVKYEKKTFFMLQQGVRSHAIIAMTRRIPAKERASLLLQH